MRRGCVTELAFPIPEELVEAVAERVAELVVEKMPAPAAEEPWRVYTVDQVAAKLGRSTRWVRDRKDLIGWVKLDDGAFAFELEDVRRFARERRIACAPLAAVEPLASVRGR